MATGQFMENVRKELKENWDKNGNVERKWDVLSSVICDTAEECL